MTATGIRSAYTLIALHGLTNLGFGLVFPFTTIYLAGRLSMGTTGAALYFAGAGAANLVVAVLLAIRTYRLSHYALATVGAVSSVIGCLTLSEATILPLALLAATCNGVGQGCFMAAIVPLLNGKIPPDQRRRVFAHRYQVQNLTLALGALIAGAAATWLGRSVLPWLFVAQAVGILPLGTVLLWGALRARDHNGTAARPDNVTVGTARTASGQGVPVRALVAMAGPAALFQLGAFAFGFSQLEATVPLVLDRLLGARLFIVSAMVALNVVVILAAQGVITGRLSKRTEIAGLRISVLFWIAAFALAAAASFGPAPVRIAGVAGYVVLFSLGECAYSCSFHPWVIASVPEHELVRANALVNSMMGIGLFAGPSLGAALVRTGSTVAVWSVLASCAATLLLTVRRSHVRAAATVSYAAKHRAKDLVA